MDAEGYHIFTNLLIDNHKGIMSSNINRKFNFLFKLFNLDRNFVLSTIYLN